MRDLNQREMIPKLQEAAEKLEVQMQVTKVTLACSLKQLHEQINKICKGQGGDIALEQMGPKMLSITRESYLETLGHEKPTNTTK